MIYGFEQYDPAPILSGHLVMGTADNGKEKIEANSRYFMKNGIPAIDVMGEIHFSRVPRSEWGDRLRKMKAGGVTIVTTYLFWIYHEETEGSFDFSGDRDIRGFILEADKLGMKVIIRIGPWAHGECRHGGFPDWLVAKGLKLRTNDPEYLKYVRNWYGHIYEQVRGLFHKDGGNIIGIQFDNELVNAPEHILELKKIALSLGFEAPLYTATGWNSKYGARLPVDEVIPVFGAYADAPWAKGIEKRPPSVHYRFDPRRNDSLVGSDIISEQATSEDGWRLPYERYPFALCELGCGIQSTYQRRTVISDMDAYAIALVKLGSGNNLIGYYMYAGGTNAIGALSTLQETRATGSPNDYSVRNYDFHTAITEYGEVSPRYGMLNMLHLFAGDFGYMLAPMGYLSASKSGDGLRYCARTDGEGGFIFVNNYQRYQKLEDICSVEFEFLGQRLPAIDVMSGASFFLPVNIKLEGMTLEYATAQPLCRSGKRYFFIRIPGAEPRFRFKGQEEFGLSTSRWDGASDNTGFRTEIRTVRDDDGHELEICLLEAGDAAYVRRIQNTSLIMGLKCNIYEAEGGLEAVEGGSFAYAELSGDFKNGRAQVVKVRPGKPTVLTHAPIYGDDKLLTQEELAEMLDYSEVITREIISQLHVPENGEIHCRAIKCEADDGFVEIGEPCDVEMIIADGRLAADKFYDRLKWRVPAGLIYGKDAYLVTTPQRDDVFMDDIE